MNNDCQADKLSVAGLLRLVALDLQSHGWTLFDVILLLEAVVPS